MIEIVRARPRTVVGLEVKATDTELHNALNRTWAMFRTRVNQIPHRVNDRFLNVSLGSHEGIHTHLICVEVRDLVSVPTGMIALAIPTHTYLHVQFEGEPGAIGSAFDELYQWARINGFAAEEFRIDEGYTRGPHDLFVRLEADRIRAVASRRA